MFGQLQHAQLNSLINERFAALGTLVVAHRGSGVGSIAENTALGVKAALLSGADMVEIDVCASKDGRFFCFHDGYESELLGLNVNLQTLTAAEIEQQSFVWLDRPGRRVTVESLNGLLRQFRSTALFAADRSWWRWPAVLTTMDSLRMHQQIILKCPAWETRAIDLLRAHPKKYPFLPTCRSPEDVGDLIEDPDLNVVGIELITTTRDHPWFDQSVIDELHRRGAFCLVNTETLTTGVPLFAGLDDETAIRVSPEAAWGPIFDLGVDAIQTDWPWLLRDFRAQYGRRAAGAATTASLVGADR